jgi:hypothetical protein
MVPEDDELGTVTYVLVGRSFRDPVWDVVVLPRLVPDNWIGVILSRPYLVSG